MYKYKLLIAEKLIEIISCKELKLTKALFPFIENEETTRKPDIVVEIQFNVKEIVFDNSWFEIDKGIYLKNNELVQCYHWRDNEYIYRIESIGREYPCRIGIPKSFTEVFCENGNILNYIALDRLLLNEECYFIHASLIQYKNETLLFTAPSGGGKSTQADLWGKYENATLLNGDKAILRIKTDGCWAYGGPIAGTSGIYVNKGGPVKAIILIEKGTSNHIKRLNPIEAYKVLYAEMIKSTWDREFNKRTLDTVEKIIQEVEMLKLTCTPDESAVECVLKYFKGA